jgi:tRNA nucleotidyltransferase (CCA-adding enzyme)
VTGTLRGALEAHPEVVRALPPLRQAAAGAPIHLVGGTVRDLLLGAETVDLDLVVVGDALPVARRLAAATGGRLTVHRAFGTAVVRGPVTADLAGARRETYPHPGSLPVVALAATLEEDLGRRDFAVNAMAASLGEESFGELCDPFGGQADLAARRLRTLTPGSFADDPTRLLRGARYAARLGFAFDDATRSRAEEAAAGIWSVGPDRLRDALELLLREDAAAAALTLLAELGALPAMGLTLAPGAVERYDAFAWEHAPDAEPWVGRFALLDAAGEHDALSPARVRRVAQAADRLVARMAAAAGDAGELARVARRAPVEAVACAAAREPALAEPAAWYLDELRHLRLEIDGDDLIRELGASPGRALGVALDAILAARLRGELMTREAQVDAARRLLSDQTPPRGRTR